MCGLSQRGVLGACLGLLALYLVAPAAATAQEEGKPARRFSGENRRWIPLPELWEGTRVDVSPYGWSVRVGSLADANLGAVLSPVDDALRSQLQLPAGRGLVVTKVFPRGAAADAGIQEHDILLTANDQPLAGSGDLRKAIKAANGKDISFDVVRGGSHLTVVVKPREAAVPRGIHLRWPPAAPYWIGVAVASVDSTLRAQLDVPEGCGVVVTEVVADSPAEKAGMKQHDVVLSVNDAAIENPQGLQEAVASSKGEELTIRLMRAGKELTMTLKAEKRDVGPGEQWRPGEQVWEFYGVPAPGVAWPWTPDREKLQRNMEERLERMSEQVEQLRQMIESLKERVPKRDLTPKDKEAPKKDSEAKKKANI